MGFQKYIHRKGFDQPSEANKEARRLIALLGPDDGRGWGEPWLRSDADRHYVYVDLVCTMDPLEMLDAPGYERVM